MHEKEVCAPYTMTELNRILQSLENEKASGFDAIPNELNLLNKSAETINYFTQSRQKKSFERKILIKVKLIEAGNFWRLWRDKELGEMVISENDVILPSLNALSEDNNIQAADLLKIPLKGPKGYLK